MRTFVEISTSVKEDLKKFEHLICLQYHLRHKLQKLKSEYKRTFAVKLSRPHIGDNSVLEIAIGAYLQFPYDILEEKHVCRALVSLLPGIRIIPESFYSCSEKDQSFLFCYLEIEKLRGNNFIFKDMALLRLELPNELKQNVQSLTSSLLFSYNEEETYKNAVHLAEELKSENDIPQVTILFQSQIQEFLLFRVIVIRVRKKNKPPFSPEEMPLPSSCHLILEKVMPLMTFPKGGVKEAILFSLETECSLFLGKNWSIDLDLARNYVAKLVEQIFGQFRDYNGGLLLHQGKKLEQIKQHLRNRFKDDHLLIQDIFYSFRPATFQAMLTLSSARRIFTFAIGCLGQHLDTEKIEVKREGNSLLLLMKMPTFSSCRVLMEELQSTQQKMHSLAGYSCFEYEREHYLFFVDLDTSLGLNVLVNLEHALQRTRENKEKQSILRLNFQEEDPPSLNPQIAVDQRCRSLEKALFEGLTRLNSHGHPEPAAAKEIRCSPCQTIYTFILRRHHWSNGEEVSAFDFEQSWKRAISPHSHCLRSDLFFVIKNAQQAHAGLKSLDEVKIKALNAKTLIVELEYPAFYFLHLLAHPIFFPLYKGEQEPYHFNGPFLLKQWEREHYLHLTSNPYYWDKQNVQLKDIIISMQKNTQLILKKFENGKLDWLGGPFTTPILGPFHSNRPWLRKRVSRIYWIYLNTQVFPLSSANIRKALACAINRKQLTQKFQGESCVFNPVLISPHQKICPWDGNISLARDFFREGLEELNISKEAFPEIVLYWSANGEPELMRLLQKQIQSALQIKITLKNIKWNSLSFLLDRREYRMAACYRSLPPFYPRSYLELFRDRTHSYNISQWENRDFKTYLDRAFQCLHSEEREKWLIEAEQIFLNEMPVIPLFFPVHLYLLNERLENVVIESDGSVDFKRISFS
jgi:oligopeptide transport system substrate-binding protein